MVNPISTPNSSQAIVVDGFQGLKTEKSKDILTPIVDRKKEVPTAREEIPREEVEKATEKLNRLMRLIDKRLEFSVHEKSNKIMVRIVDQESGEVLDEIPSKKILDILSSFSEMVGLFFDKRA